MNNMGMPASSEAARPIRRLVGSPGVLILLVAPFFGEGLSGSTPPLDLLLPWNLAFMSALYGCGALICRDVAHRFGLGFSGLVVLAIAYAVWEEALVDRYWFFPQFWEDSGVGAYSVVWHTNVLLALHLTFFHTAVSMCASILVVEWLAPDSRNRPWVGRPGLGAAGVVLAATPLIYGEFDQRPPTPVLVAAAVLLASIVACAFWLRRGLIQIRSRTSRQGPHRARRGLGPLAFTCVFAHWIATYTVAETGLPWPLGVTIAMLPVAVGLFLIPRLARTGPYGNDGVRVVVGLLTFFVLLDILVGLLGRYDMIVAAGLTAWGIRRLYTRQTSGQAEAAGSST